MDAIYYLTGILIIPIILALMVFTILFLIKPHLLNDRKVVKSPFSRPKILLIGVIAITVSFFSFGSVLAATEPASVKEARAAAEASVQKTVDTSESTKQEEKKPETIVKTESAVQVIPFETIEEQTSSVAQGQSKVKVEGENGEKTTIYEVTYVNGEETTRIVKSEEVTKTPITEVISIGTYVAPAAKPKASSSSCNPNYSGCVPNVSYDLNCPDIGYKVQVLGYDQYRLDADDDGWGCDSY